MKTPKLELTTKLPKLPDTSIIKDLERLRNQQRPKRPELRIYDIIPDTFIKEVPDIKTPDSPRGPIVINYY